MKCEWSNDPEVQSLVTRITDVVWDAHGGCASGKKALLAACGIEIPWMDRPQGTGKTFDRGHLPPTNDDPQGKIGGWHGDTADLNNRKYDGGPPADKWGPNDPRRAERTNQQLREAMRDQ